MLFLFQNKDDETVKEQPQNLNDVLRIRREMAKKSANEKEKRQAEERKQRQIQAERERLDRQKASLDEKIQVWNGISLSPSNQTIQYLMKPSATFFRAYRPIQKLQCGCLPLGVTAGTADTGTCWVTLVSLSRRDGTEISMITVCTTLTATRTVRRSWTLF